MTISAISFTGNKKPLTKKQKAGAIAGAAVATVAVAATTVAAIKGKKVAPKAKLFGKNGQISKGFVAMGSEIKAGFNKVKKAVVNFFHKDNKANKAPKTEAPKASKK